MDPQSAPRPERPRWLVWAAFIVVAVVAVAALGVALGHRSSPAPAAAPGRGATSPHPALELAFVRGRDERFHVTQIMQGRLSAGSRSAPFDMQMQADVRWQVGGVAADGTAALTVHLSHVALDVDGEQTPVPPVPPTHLRITTDGRVLLSDGTTLFDADVQGPSKIGADQVSAILPAGGTHERTGARWTRTVRCVVFGQPLTYVAHSTYLRTQSLDAVDTAVVRTETNLSSFHLTIELKDLAALLHLPANEAAAGASITYAGSERASTLSWVDPSARRLMKTVTHARFVTRTTANGIPGARLPAGGLRMIGSLKMTIERA